MKNKIGWSASGRHRNVIKNNLSSSPRIKVYYQCIILVVVLCYWYHVTQYNQPHGRAVGD